MSCMKGVYMVKNVNYKNYDKHIQSTAHEFKKAKVEFHQATQAYQNKASFKGALTVVKVSIEAAAIGLAAKVTQGVLTSIAAIAKRTSIPPPHKHKHTKDVFKESLSSVKKATKHYTHKLPEAKPKIAKKAKKTVKALKLKGKKIIEEKKEGRLSQKIHHFMQGLSDTVGFWNPFDKK